MITQTTRFTRLVPRKWEAWENSEIRSLAQAILISPFHTAKLFAPTKAKLGSSDFAKVREAIATVFKFEDKVTYLPEIYADWAKTVLTPDEKRAAQLFALAIGEGRREASSMDRTIELLLDLESTDVNDVRAALHACVGELKLTAKGEVAKAAAEEAARVKREDELAEHHQREDERQRLIAQISDMLSQGTKNDYSKWFWARLGSERQRQLMRYAGLSQSDLRGLFGALRAIEPALIDSIRLARQRHDAEAAKRAEVRQARERKAVEQLAPTNGVSREEARAILRNKPNSQGMPGSAPQRGKVVGGAGKKPSGRGKK